MTTLAQLSALVGALMPILIAIVIQYHWSRPVKTVVGLACSFIASILTPAIYTTLTWHTWGTSAVAILLASLATYTAVWVPLGARKFEYKTTIDKSKVPAGGP